MKYDCIYSHLNTNIQSIKYTYIYIIIIYAKIPEIIFQKALYRFKAVKSQVTHSPRKAKTILEVKENPQS